MAVDSLSTPGRVGQKTLPHTRVVLKKWRNQQRLLCARLNLDVRLLVTPGSDSILDEHKFPPMGDPCGAVCSTRSFLDHSSGYFRLSHHAAACQTGILILSLTTTVPSGFVVVVREFTSPDRSLLDNRHISNYRIGFGSFNSLQNSRYGPCPTRSPRCRHLQNVE